ncbi:MAG: hypothetical protein GEEBNDBF_00547 [bacterium]|nr:hypothetical protein [bacterium]
MRELWWCFLSGWILMLGLSGFGQQPAEAADHQRPSRPLRLIEVGQLPPLEGRVTLMPGGHWTSPVLSTSQQQQVTLVLTMEEGTASVSSAAVGLSPRATDGVLVWQRTGITDLVQMEVQADPLAISPVSFRWQLWAK